MNKKQANALLRLFCPLSRPARISPRKRVKWRLVKKWLNRYEKQHIIGSTVTAVSKTGGQILMRVTDVHIYKAGGRNKSYNISAEPLSMK